MSLMAMTGPRYAPEEIQGRLGLTYSFSPEQLRVIGAPADEPLLVVAGAGSGKTELMALRVVWLVANGYVRADQVLGLTFTRKAAGELAHRVRLYLGRARRLVGNDQQLDGEPTVATYHSFAARVVREHGMRAGFEPTVRLLTEAACWQLADVVVRHHDSPAMRAFPLTHGTATTAVLALAGELSEHLRDPDDVEKLSLGLAARIEGISGGRLYKDVKDVLARQQARLALLPLVREYGERKRRAEAMDFGDQLARAAVVARDHPEVGLAERDRFRVVLLDEYQDTSQAQAELLRALFGDGHPVTAVGDPCQSIYGWRGASAGTLERFPRYFARAGGESADHLPLSMSFRNAPHILEVANQISEELRADSTPPVRPLRAAPGYRSPFAGLAGPGESAPPLVRCAYAPSYVDEAEWVADQVVAAWQAWADAGRDDAAGGGPPQPTTAVLVRARSQIVALERALRERGLPVEVVGLGGLLDTPEVRDVVSTVQVLADPTAGAALLRLLTGARWRVGPRDVVALYRRARAVAHARRAEATGGRPPQMAIPGLGAADEPDLGGERLEDAILADALDDLGAPHAYSAEGYRRLCLFRDELRDLRARLDQSLPDLVADVAATIGLDVEVAARPGGPAGLARAHLDALGDVAARFAEESEGGTLSALLAYLEAAEEEERGLTPGDVEVVDGAVQILTVHAAKGLEWDVVAVTGLCADAFPSQPKSSDHWLKGLGVLPFPLRGDAAGLPALRFETVTDAKGVQTAVARFEQAWREHQEREERRLAYVAVTRPRHLLLCSGFRWGAGLTRPRAASVFLEEVAEVCRQGAGEVMVWTPPPSPDGTNPTLADEISTLWPEDPIGPRRAAVEEGAAMVRAALATPAAADGSPIEMDEETLAWETEAGLLLAERERQRAGETIDVSLPAHVSVSQLVALHRDPHQLARRLRRPLPEAPDVHARRGTAFHLWLERRFGGEALLDLDELPGAGDEEAAPDADLEELRQAFLDSDWSDRTPDRVEVPFATVVAGVVVRGRMDAVFRREHEERAPANPAVASRRSPAPGPHDYYDVIDWKTGQRPAGAEAAAAAVQLAAYRLAWAELAGVPVTQVSAGFHYVRSGETVRPVDLLDVDALAALVASVPGA